jgi:hypothetical protein
LVRRDVFEALEVPLLALLLFALLFAQRFHELPHQRLQASAVNYCWQSNQLAWS